MGVKAEQLFLLPIVQSALHPSPSILFPSSHSSVPTVMLSPHFDWQNVKFSIRYHPSVQFTQIDALFVAQ
jgi:hypothetical protein